MFSSEETHVFHLAQAVLSHAVSFEYICPDFGMFSQYNRGKWLKTCYFYCRNSPLSTFCLFKDAVLFDLSDNISEQISVEIDLLVIE